MEDRRSEVVGVVQEAETGEGVAGVLVEVTGDAPRRLVRTGKRGEFRLAKRESWPADAAIVVRDGKDTLSTIPLSQIEQGNARVLIPGEQLGARRKASTVLSPNVLPTIESAIATLGEGSRVRARAAFDRMLCGLPPVFEIPDLVRIARGALAGRVGDAVKFRDSLAQLDAWNASRHAAQPRMNHTDATAVLRDVAKRKSRKHAPHTHADAAVSREAAVVLTAAAFFSSNDPSTIVHNVQIVHEQLGAARHLEPLLRSAHEALDGEPARFVQMIRAYGGMCPFPVPPFPEPPFPEPHDPSGIPFPIPAPSPWYLPGPHIEDCPEIVDAIADARARARSYTLDSITPDHACPGTTITIHGSGFVGDVPPMVGFNVFDSSETLFVEVTVVSDTELTVVVPDRAVCGLLEINLFVMESQIVCGELIDFPATTTSDPLFFDGGVVWIRSFRRTPEGCVHAGDTVRFTFDVCNADLLGIRVLTNETGRTDVREERFVLDPHDRSFDYVTPSYEDNNGTVRVTLAAEGCGDRMTSEIAFGLQHVLPTALPSPSYRPFENWHGNVTRHGVGMLVPGNLDNLVRSVRMAERLHSKIGVAGSQWSYTPCIVPRGTAFYVDTRALDNRVGPLDPYEPINFVLQAARRSEIRSVLGDNIIGTLDAANRGLRLAERPDITPTVIPLVDRLVHIEAGIKLYNLNCMLEYRGLAIPNLGGANGQSFAGVMGTSTHGANCDMPPIPDLVRAIHLVANGGQQWWIEPDDNPITDEAAMRELMLSGRLDPCLELRYDRTLFDACLVAMGHAGIIYSVVVEAVPRHTLFESTELIRWPTAQERINRLLAGDDPYPWYLEISLNPTENVWWTTRTPYTGLPDAEVPSGGHELDTQHLIFWLFGAGTLGAIVGLGGAVAGGVIGLLFAGFSTYFILKQAELVRIFSNPFEWWRLPEVFREIELAISLVNVIDGLVRAIAAAADGGDADEALADMMPDLLNALWRIGFFGISGRTIINEIQNRFTSMDQRPPGTYRDLSYRIYTEQIECGDPEHPETVENPPRVWRATAFERLIHSQEYIVRPEELVNFTQRVLDAAKHVREEDNRALILILNLRFTLATRASLGMQQHERSSYVEIWTVAGMEGNAAFYEAVNDIVDELEAIPHWGHDHRVTDLHGRYPRWGEWKSALDRIAGHAGRPNTFRHQFGIDRGILPELPEP